jgi:hypothetical protein
MIVKVHILENENIFFFAVWSVMLYEMNGGMRYARRVAMRIMLLHILSSTINSAINHAIN